MKQLFLALGVLFSCGKPHLSLTASQTTLLANGYDRALLTVTGTANPPKLEMLGDRHTCRLKPPKLLQDHWQSELDAGVLPGSIQIKVTANHQHLTQTITLKPQTTDSASDGTPDFLRLEDNSDRDAFRRALTDLAEIQYFIAPASRPQEIIDCSSFVRYAYREALRDHNSIWLSEAHLPFVPALPSIQKYSFPHTLLGPNIYRTQPGTYTPADLSNGTFTQFADAKTLQQRNTFFISRDVSRAKPGDILFYRRETTKGSTYHSMIFIGPSHIKPDAEIYVVYHTGPDGTSDGEIRRLTLTQLLQFPNPQWQPIAANPLFLGVYRWNILKAIS